MAVVVTILINSGLPDPIRRLTDEESSALAQAIARLEEPTLVLPPGLSGRPGYRGFEIRTNGEFGLPASVYVHEGIVDVDCEAPNFLDPTRTVERLLTGMAKAWLTPGLFNLLSSEIELKTPPEQPPIIESIHAPCLSAEIFTHLGWTGQVRKVNNCYNYANYKKLDGFGYPGFNSTGTECDISCAKLINAACADGLTVAPPNINACPLDGHFVALLIRPPQGGDPGDFHWLRRDRLWGWSQKVGTSAVRKSDRDGHPISDVQTADLFPYTQFCGFLHSIPANVSICGATMLNCP